MNESNNFYNICIKCDKFESCNKLCIFKCMDKFKVIIMNTKTAKNIVGNRATWELKAMIKALTMFQVLNTDEENLQLEACKVLKGDQS